MHSGKGAVPFLKVYNIDPAGHVDFTIKPTFVDRSTHEGLLRRSCVVPGDVLINIVGPPLGKVAVVPATFGEWNINQAIAAFRPSAELSSTFLRLLLSSEVVQRPLMRTAKATAGQSNLSISNCRRLWLPVPSLDEQHRIVMRVDEAFAALRRAIEQVERPARRLRVLSDSVLNFAVPATTTRPIGDFLVEARYGTSVKCSPDFEGCPVARIPNVCQGQFSPDDVKFAVNDEPLVSTALEEGDILFVRTNGSRDLIGRSAVARGVRGWSFASYLIRFRLNGDLLPDYVQAVLETGAIRRTIEMMAASSAGQYNVSIPKLKSLEVPIIDIESQVRIISQVQAMKVGVDRLGSDLQRVAAKAKSLRSAILDDELFGREAEGAG